MSFPAAYLGSLTATGDAITGPGAPNVLIGGMPAACVGDLVAGGVVTSGSIVFGSMTVMIGGRPAARVTSPVAGVNASGAPVSTTITLGNMTVLIGG
jgi:uncharacterized Zn-binding protein involved in type VI secretion